MKIVMFTGCFGFLMLISIALAAPKNQDGRCSTCGKLYLKGSSHVCIARKNRISSVPVDVPVRKNTKVQNPGSAANRTGASFQSRTNTPNATVKHKLRTREAIAKGTSGGADAGNAETEACVEKVLWWLKSTQNSDGSWSGGQSCLVNTSFALLTFLAHNEFPGSTSPNEEDFAPVVQRTIDWLCNQVSNEGGKCRMRGVDGNEYGFLIATYALCEAYGITRDMSCKEAAQACVKRIVDGQSPTGGWDYKINPHSTRDDLSFSGWALQALKAARMAGVTTQGFDTCIKKAVNCLKTRNFKDGGFGYYAGGNPTGLTATGCLVMQLLGCGNQREVTQALDYMREWKPTFDSRELSSKSQGGAPQYYCYYATQCKYNAGANPFANRADTQAWRKWNAHMKDLYIRSIYRTKSVTDAKGELHEAGYYENSDAHSSRPIMDSCLVALQLMVYYRYLPQGRNLNQYFDVERRSEYPELVKADEYAKKSRERKKADADAVREIRAKHADLQATVLAALIARGKAMPERHCEVHKWKEEFAPKFNGDLYTEQQKTAYAQNYMKALELMRDGLLKCTCNSSYWKQKYDAADKLYEDADAKMRALEQSHPEIDFSRQ